MIAVFVLVGFGIAASYWLLANRWLSQWMNRGQELPNPPGLLPAVTFLRPLKRDTPRLVEALEELVRATGERDQLLLGIEAGLDADVVGENLRSRFPERAIELVHCKRSPELNPKICKLLQMVPKARHEHWILSDSEALLDATFLNAFRREWASSGADALTAGYRFTHLDTLPKQLDAAAPLLTLWPGLAVLRRFHKVHLTLGACTAIRRSDLDAVGGLAAFSRDLAEDNRLGKMLAQSGRSVRLSAQVVTLVSDAMSWRDYWRHQRRVAVTYRVSNPTGFSASIITHGLSLAVIVSLLNGPIFPTEAVLAVGLAWLVRWLTVRWTARLTNFPIPNLAVVVLVASLVETMCWVLAWFSHTVWWAGKQWRVSRDGKLTVR